MGGGGVKWRLFFEKPFIQLQSTNTPYIFFYSRIQTKLSSSFSIYACGDFISLAPKTTWLLWRGSGVLRACIISITCSCCEVLIPGQILPELNLSTLSLKWRNYLPRAHIDKCSVHAWVISEDHSLTGTVPYVYFHHRSILCVSWIGDWRSEEASIRREYMTNATSAILINIHSYRHNVWSSISNTCESCLARNIDWLHGISINSCSMWYN